ncbi:Aldo/keto reductase [Cadophora sp. DSE1049]|nr:Aldo/keto reductase [Cadophora sp. DSE1049]
MALPSANGGHPPKGKAKAAHVNMMTDTVIANLPPDALRGIVRGLLGFEQNLTSHFHDLAAKYLLSTKPASTPSDLFEKSTTTLVPTSSFFEMQSRVRCLMGCGFGFESIRTLTDALRELSSKFENDSVADEQLSNILASIDGDVVQAVTAVQKELLTGSGSRAMTASEQEIVKCLRSTLTAWSASNEDPELKFAFARGFTRLAEFEGGGSILPQKRQIATQSSRKKDRISETVQLGSLEVPRMFAGLWQFSSPAWGTASRAQINADFRKHVDAGFTAYDMADHYGDAEVTFVSADWKKYDDHQYVQAAKLIADHPKVQNLGLCNFDTQRMDELVEAGVKVVSNQVQFSLIDLRPTFKMAASCRKHNVKLLTYGSLCGGFLADKWLNKPAPNLFDKNMTPSHRKYFEMIEVWGGWILFQELLSTLSAIGKKYNTSISTTAVRWILDHDYVGAVIVGARMGISEHVDENLEVFNFKLDGEDQAGIQRVLDKCKAKDVFAEMGDCGAEYRQ